MITDVSKVTNPIPLFRSDGLPKSNVFRRGTRFAVAMFHSAIISVCKGFLTTDHRGRPGQRIRKFPEIRVLTGTR